MIEGEIISFLISPIIIIIITRGWMMQLFFCSSSSPILLCMCERLGSLLGVLVEIKRHITRRTKEGRRTERRRRGKSPQLHYTLRVVCL